MLLQERCSAKENQRPLFVSVRASGRSARIVGAKVHTPLSQRNRVIARDGQGNSRLDRTARCVAFRCSRGTHQVEAIMRTPIVIGAVGLIAAMALSNVVEARPLGRAGFHAGGFAHPGIRPGWHGAGTRWVGPGRPGWHGGGVRWATPGWGWGRPGWGWGRPGWGWPVAAGVAAGTAWGAASYASCRQDRWVWNGRRYVIRRVWVC
jgi:hypothetical protein